MLSLKTTGIIATVTLDRPPVNAWDDAALDSLEAIIGELRCRSDISLVVVRSRGKHFSAGADIKMMADAVDRADMSILDSFAARIQSLFAEWERLEVPTLAVVHGAATGGGLEFALACDMRIATESARIGLTEGKLGLLPAGGGTQRLTRIVGRGRALRFMLTSELVDGHTAELLGLVEWCVPDADEDAEVERIIALLTQSAGPAKQAVKRCVALTGTTDGYAMELIGQRSLHADAGSQQLIKDFVTNRRNS